MDGLGKRERVEREDLIIVSNLELRSHIGVTVQEQETAQRLTVCLEMEPKGSLAALADDLSRTVDYFAVSQKVQQLAMDRPRNLIETLAAEIAALVLREFPVARVQVELRKYILPDTEYVAVRISRPTFQPTDRP